MKNILVTGGAGYIGSHTVLKLLLSNYKVIILDSNINSSPLVIKRIKNIVEGIDSEKSKNLTFVKGDLRNINVINQIFEDSILKNSPIDSVMHFSGLKSVSYSRNYPLIYWEVNVIGTINLLKIMAKNNCKNLIFSSSATVYGEFNSLPFKETDKLFPVNPYANTKETIERILVDLSQSRKDKWKITNLRYFNPIGAHESGQIGEDPKGTATNLFPLILNSIIKKQKLYIFGNDWPTYDGTCIRDYIHIEDLAEGHLKALEQQFIGRNGFNCFNLGTGKGTSVLELIDIFEKINNVKIDYQISPRRTGDTAILVADNSLAREELNWMPKRSLDDMCKDGYKWIRENPNGYDD